MAETTNKRPSTRQLLDKIPNVPCLYRHSVNGTYYGIKKIAGKRKEHSLETDDRKIADRKLKAWISNLDKIDSEAEKTTFAELLKRFQLTRKPTFSNLAIGTNYVLQTSTNLAVGFTDYGSAFTATNNSMVYPQYFDVANWSQMFFRVRTSP